MKKKIIIILVIGAVMLVSFLIYWNWQKKNQDISQYETARVTRSTLTQTISATGAVKGEANIDLSFSFAGTVELVLVKVGDAVRKGQELAMLKTRDLEIEMDRAESALDLAQANLNLKLVGVNESTKSVAQAEIDKAQASLESAQRSFNSSASELSALRENISADEASAKLAVEAANDDLESAHMELENIQKTNTQNIDNAYQNSIVEMQGNITHIQKSLSDMDAILGVTDDDINDAFETLLKAKSSQTFIDAQLAYSQARLEYDESSVTVKQLYSFSSYKEVDAAVTQTKDALADTYTALSQTRDVLDQAVVGDGLSSTQLGTFETTIDGNRTLINTESNALEAARQAIETARLSAQTKEDTYQNTKDAATNALSQAQKSLLQVQSVSERSLVSAQAKVDNALDNIEIAAKALALAQANYNNVVAAPREADVAALRAEVRRAQAALELAKKNVLDAVLISPSDAIITSVSIERGEQVTSQTIVISMLEHGAFRVEVDISESDIAKVSLNDSAEITLDAYGDDIVFESTVVAIDPGPTIIQDVIYYQVEFDINATGYTIKPDMTANVTIFTKKEENVLIIPTRAVVSSGGAKKVRVLDGTKVMEKEVVTGLRGDNGFVEVQNGLLEGEQVIVFDKSEKKGKF